MDDRSFWSLNILDAVMIVLEHITIHYGVSLYLVNLVDTYYFISYFDI
jgi:hypothetical protein